MLPFVSPPSRVQPGWVDENGHMNLAYYVVLFDWATDALWQAIGLGDRLRATNHGTFAVETHTLYKAELLVDETATTRSQILGLDAKRLHVAHEMVRDRDSVIAAQQEIMFLCVDLSNRRTAPFPPSIVPGLRQAADQHAIQPPPPWAGRRIAMPARQPA